jgi:hypothetical protein
MTKSQKEWIIGNRIVEIPLNIIEQAIQKDDKLSRMALFNNYYEIE